MVSAVIRGLGHSVPQSVGQEELWDAFFAGYFGGDRRAAVAWRRSGVDRRGGVALPPGDDVSGWGTAARMERFHRDAPPLAVEAANRALEKAGVSVGQVDQLLTVTCTGYGTPGVDAALAAKLGLGAATTSVTLGHMGCHAALPGLRVAADAAAARERTVLLVCVELTSLHLQAPRTDLDQIVAHSLFADAAAAAVVTAAGPGWEVVDDASHTDRAWAEMLT